MEAARLHVDEIAGLALLTGGEKFRRFRASCRTVICDGMRIPLVCDRVSPLNDAAPGETTTVDGLTPDAPIVTVGSADPPPGCCHRQMST